MAKYRGHISRWQIVKTSAILLFASAIVGFNIFWIVQGLLTGAIESLRRRSHELIYFSSDPGWFRFNICVRTLGIVMFSAAIVIYWRRLREELRDM